MKRHGIGILMLAALCLGAPGGQAMAEDTASVTVDFSKAHGRLKPMHGINKGPLGAGELVDVTTAQHALNIPYTRLHDCHWPVPDVVDMHVVFPDPKADPTRPESYDFRMTDDYLAAIQATGARVIYRLGESIEHTGVKRFVHPPADPERWAQAAIGIIRHYNEGWANGFRYNIRYWEIWNEPDIGPLMWSGTDKDYFRLYGAAARAIKARFPDVMVGGPGLGNTGQLQEVELKPSAFLSAFLDFCKRGDVPLDFLSWHCYTFDPAELAARAREVRRVLDSAGFPRTESQLNEWNYIARNDWGPMGRGADPLKKQAFYEQMAGAPGAAFLAAGFLLLQDVPLDVSCMYHGEVGEFGLFNSFGVPQRNYYAVLAFSRLLETPERVEASAALPLGLAAGAGLAKDRGSASVLVSHYASAPGDARLTLKGLPWQGGAHYEVRVVDEAHNLETAAEGTLPGPEGVIPLRWNGPAVALVTLRPAETARR